MTELHGRRALVTGGASGIGRAIAESLVAAGAQVVISDIDREAGSATASEIGDAVRFVACDVTDGEQVAAAVSFATGELGGLDILVNNAGVEILKPLLEQTDEEFRRLMDINVTGVFLGMKHALPTLTESRGVIVNMASVAGINGCPLLGSYCASKAGVIQLTRVAALELRDAGIRVNAVCPAFVDTPMVDRAGPIVESALGTPFSGIVEQVQGRLGTTAEVAEVVRFLASDRASWTTGSHYVVDGGMTANLL